MDVKSLETSSDNTAKDMLLMWRLGRMVEQEFDLPSFSAFCARLLPYNVASKIAYLPLIPASPTDPAILKETMTLLVNTSYALGDRWPVITGDQATYELAATIGDKHCDKFANVVLLLGGFHLAQRPFARSSGTQVQKIFLLQLVCVRRGLQRKCLVRRRTTINPFMPSKS